MATVFPFTTSRFIKANFIFKSNSKFNLLVHIVTVTHHGHLVHSSSGHAGGVARLALQHNHQLLRAPTHHEGVELEAGVSLPGEVELTL